MQAKELQVVHGRLREKTIGKIARDTIGSVMGLAEDAGSVSVQVAAMVADKSKVITANFSAGILEPQKGDSEQKPPESSRLVKDKKFGFLSGPGGTTLEVFLFVCTASPCEPMQTCCTRQHGQSVATSLRSGVFTVLGICLSTMPACFAPRPV